MENSTKTLAMYQIEKFKRMSRKELTEMAHFLNIAKRVRPSLSYWHDVVNVLLKQRLDDELDKHLLEGVQ